MHRTLEYICLILPMGEAPNRSRITLLCSAVRYSICGSADVAGIKQRALLQKALGSALQLSDLKKTSAQSTAMNTAFLAWAEEINSNCVFAEALVSMIIGAALCGGRSLNSRYQIMWTGYHHLSISLELSTLWSCHLMTNEHTETFVPHFIQLVTRRVMDESVKIAFPVDSGHSEDMQHDCPLKADEEQALRYTAGYET